MDLSIDKCMDHHRLMEKKMIKKWIGGSVGQKEWALWMIVHWIALLEFLALMMMWKTGFIGFQVISGIFMVVIAGCWIQSVMAWAGRWGELGKPKWAILGMIGIGYSVPYGTIALLMIQGLMIGLPRAKEAKSEIRMDPRRLKWAGWIVGGVGALIGVLIGGGLILERFK